MTVRLHHYNGFANLILDRGEGGDWADYGMIEPFANIAGTVTLIVEGEHDDQDKDRNGGGYGHAAVTLTPDEARWLGAKLLADADEAVANAQRPRGPQ